MAILSLDLGERRVGVAISHGLMAGALQTLDFGKGSHEPFYLALRKIIIEQGVDKIIIGLPLGAEGRETQQSKFSKRLGGIISEELKLPVIYVEESYSTQEAIQNLGKIKKLSETKKIDAEAARIILEQYLNENRS